MTPGQKEDAMNYTDYLKPLLEAYRGNDLAPGSLDVDESVDGSAITRSHSAANGTATEEIPAEKKREEQIELWMNDIKSFIRNIDISSL